MVSCLESCLQRSCEGGLEGSPSHNVFSHLSCFREKTYEDLPKGISSKKICISEPHLSGITTKSSQDIVPQEDSVLPSHLQGVMLNVTGTNPFSNTVLSQDNFPAPLREEHGEVRAKS